DRPAIRLRCELRDDLLGAEIGVGTLARMARENALAARRRAQARRVERPADLERAHAIDAILAAAGHEHLRLVVRFGKRAAAERDADRARAGLRREADVLQPRVDLLHDAALDLIVRAHILFAADDGLVDRL